MKGLWKLFTLLPRWVIATGLSLFEPDPDLSPLQNRVVNIIVGLTASLIFFGILLLV